MVDSWISASAESGMARRDVETDREGEGRVGSDVGAAAGMRGIVRCADEEGSGEEPPRDEAFAGEWDRDTVAKYVWLVFPPFVVKVVIVVFSE